MVITATKEEARLVSSELMKSYMRRGEWAVRPLADEVDFRLRRSYKKRYKHDEAAPAGCKKSTVGNLRSGYRTTVHPDTADAICEIFGIPTEGLFLIKRSNIQREVGPRRAA